MRLIIEKHDKGYTVRDHQGPESFWGVLCAATTISEALAFIRSRMEPEGEKDAGERATDMVARLVAEGMSERAAQRFIQSEMDRGRIKLGKGMKLYPAEPEGEAEKPLDKLQRLGQEYDHTPTDPPKRTEGEREHANWIPEEVAWKRAKQGDKVQCISGDWYTYLLPEPQSKLWRCLREDGAMFLVDRERIVKVLPETPRHGDFGSMGEE